MTQNILKDLQFLEEMLKVRHGCVRQFGDRIDAMIGARNTEAISQQEIAIGIDQGSVRSSIILNIPIAHHRSPLQIGCVHPRGKQCAQRIS